MLVEAEVLWQLEDATPEVTEAIVAWLRVFEHNVFETRTMPKPPPERELDLEINLRLGLVQPNCRPYRVSTQHVPELNRQIQILLDTGIICKSLS